MANADVTVQLNTAAPLDTANPPTARPAGVLIEAQNLGSRWWGPRTPNRADTWLGRRITTGGRQSRFLTFNGSTQWAYGVTRQEAVRDLGIHWTVDLWFGLADVDEALSTVAATANLNLFEWYSGITSNTVAAIKIYVGGPNGPAGDLRKIKAVVKTTSSAGVLGNTYTITSSSQVPVNTGSWSSNYSKVTHARLVRDGSDLRLYVNGVLEATETVHESQPHQGGYNEYGGWVISASGSNWIGIIPRVVLRTNAYIGPVVDSNLFNQCPHSGDVRLSLGLTDSGMNNDGVRDSSNSHLNGRFLPARATVSATWQVPGGNPVQGIAHYVNRTGKQSTCAMIGGTLRKGYS